MMEKPRYTFPENTQTLVTFNVGESTSRPKCVSTPFPQLTMSWINEAEMRKSLDDLVTSHSIEGRRDFPDFEMLDARIASALKKIIINSSFKRRVSVEEQRAQKTKSILERKRPLPGNRSL